MIKNAIRIMLVAMAPLLLLSSSESANYFTDSFSSNLLITKTISPPLGHHPPLKLTNSTYTFTESEIVANPGETVQVCVDKNPAAIGGNVRIRPIGNTTPHISGFTQVILNFSTENSQICFDLTIASDESIGEYFLGIYATQANLVNEVLRMVVETSTQPGLCGVAPAIGNISQENAIAIDRFGNYYSAEMITIPETISSQGVSNSGGGSNCGCEDFEDEGISLTLFEPYFEDCILGTGNGFNHTNEGPARRKVVCAVLQYLETVIVPNNSVCNSEELQPINKLVTIIILV